MIAFFDMFDYVLTNMEIWRMLDIKCELNEVVETADNMINLLNPPFERGQIPHGQIETKNGFYFLAGREKNVRERLSRYNFTDRKFKRAVLAAKIFKFIPWIKMIAVGNLLGAHNLKDDSDIDFFIIAEDKRIWLTRFFCAGITKLLGLRPQTDNSRDKICLSFYVSEKAMDLSGLMLPRDSIASLQNDRKNYDIYFTYWLAGLTPIYDVGGIYKKLIKENSWLNAGLPNWEPVNPGRQRCVRSFFYEFYHDVIDLFCGGLETWFKKLQLKLLPKNLTDIMNKDTRVVMSDAVLKMHANDRREEYGKKFAEKIEKLIR